MEKANFFSKSQAGQEYWVASMLNFKEKGFFVDIGAHDGVFLSNTYGLESQLQWSGICIEADKNRYNKLQNNRYSKNVCIATRNYKGFCEFNPNATDGFVEADSKDGKTPCDTLDNILTNNNAPKHIDYISLDIEGLEYEVLSSFNFKNWDVNLWTIEHNAYLDGGKEKEKIYQIMTKNGYKRIKEDAKAPTEMGMVEFEDWYQKL